MKIRKRLAFVVLMAATVLIGIATLIDPESGAAYLIFAAEKTKEAAKKYASAA